MFENIDFVGMPLEQLDARGKELSEAIKGKYLNEERLLQVQHEIGCISFELWQRYNAGEVEIVEV